MKTSDFSFSVGGENNHLVLVFTESDCYIYDLKNEGKLVKHVVHKEKMEFWRESITIGKTVFIFHTCFTHIIVVIH